MKLRLLILGLLASICLNAVGQGGIDVTKLTADTKTFIFDNNKNTVKGYIYAELEERTACCGSDRIYLEVKIDPSGYVVKVNPLTGKNDCLKRSAADIVKNVKWDASTFKAPKSIYFEIKPDVSCDAGKDNVYAQLDVYNNQLLDANGSQVAGTGAVIRKDPTPTTPAPKAEPKPETVEAKPEPDKTADPIAEAKPPKVEEKEPVATSPAVEEKPAPSTPAVTPPPAEEAVANTNTPTLTPPSYPQGNPAIKDKSIEDARLRADADRAAQTAEIQALKDQMAELRQKAEEAREAEKRRAEQQAERFAQNDEVEEDRGSNRNRGRRSRGVKRNNDDGDVGGLFLDPAEEGDGEPETAQGEPDPDMSNEDRIREEITNLEQQLREMETNSDKQRNETERQAMEMFRIAEQIAQKEELAAQEREQNELRRLEEDRQRAEDDRRKEEEAYQRMMDEIQRLQVEADDKIAALENQRRDMERLAELKKAREQEILLEKTLRQQNQELMLEEKRIRYMGQTSGVTASRSVSPAGAGTSNTDVAAILNSLDFSSDVDSEKLKILVQTINQLQGELTRLQGRIITLEGGDASTTTNALALDPTTRSIMPGNPTDPPKPSGAVIPANLKTGTDLSIADIMAPDMKESDYITVRVEPTPAPIPVIKTNPRNPNAPASSQTAAQPEPKDPGHKDTYWDGPGPKFEARVYVEGEAKMKELIKEQLRAGGICGLGQAAFSLVLDPQGNVLNQTILAVNSPVVEMQLGTILPTLKFNSVDYRYRQTIYLQFKAEILCEGTQKIELQNVNNIIKD